MDQIELLPEDAEELTINSYNQSAEAWAAAHGDNGFWDPEISIFNNLLPEGTILEIGCGGGRDAKRLIELGYDYIGTDPAPEFVALSQRENPTGRFDVSNVHDLAFEPDYFDGFWASAVLLHVPKPLIDDALQRLHEVTIDGAVGFIAIKEGEGERIIKETSKDGSKYERFWAFYSDEEFQEVLMRNGFDLVDFIYKPMGERTRWLIYFVRVIKGDDRIET